MFRTRIGCVAGDASLKSSHLSCIWDRELDGPEALVVIRAPARRSGLELANLLLRSALWAFVACGFVEILRAMRELGPSNLAWQACVTLLWSAGVFALFPDLPGSILRGFRLMRECFLGGGPQPPAAAA
jgi:hypothetical protein